MSKRHEAKYKVDRALGVNLWGRAKSPFNRRPYRPGEKGQMPHKPTEYGRQLLAKQKIKKYYGNISERQFKKYYLEAVRRKGDTSETLIGILESRLDAVIYRMKFVPTVFAARQFVNHGHVTVNGKKVDIASYLVKEGDIVEVKKASKDLAIVVSAQESEEREIPAYLEVDEQSKKGKFISVPKLEDVPYPVEMEPNVVVAFYSR